MSQSNGRRVAVITGVSRRIGIGAAVARRFTGAGVDVFLHHWEPHDAEQPWGADRGGAQSIVDELVATGVRVEQLAADFAEPSAPATVIDAAVAAFGHIDILVANHARSGIQTLEALTADEVDLTYAVNTRATLLLVKEFARQHDDERPGRVIMMTSGQHRGPMPAELPYIASKGALHQLTLSLAHHLAPRNITVNTVDPGATDTGYADEETTRAVIEHAPMGRWGHPDDAAKLISWLTGPDAGWVTGQVIVSNGGGW
ncbi:SDR family oxidoreductase [Pseudonocardia sp. TRM90224]|uniref:SDR family oxidoreductase n=1 Tax=Pseudonocardia sp. TRM90224 TaxID=2812678 RepID=UPI001E3AB6A0|nr:SDR family oxidoreductase [Pseudonocardia sp. TRM90224]